MIGRTREEFAANHAKILDSIPPAYRPFVEAIKDTGPRPGEAAAATGADFKPEAGAFVVQKESTRRGGQFSRQTAGRKDCVIFLRGATPELVQGLAAPHPTGPLFCRGNGRRFSGPRVVDQFAQVRKRTGPRKVTAYSDRHQFATDMINAGCRRTASR